MMRSSVVLLRDRFLHLRNCEAQIDASLNKEYPAKLQGGMVYDIPPDLADPRFTGSTLVTNTLYHDPKIDYTTPLVLT